MPPSALAQQPRDNESVLEATRGRVLVVLERADGENETRNELCCAVMRRRSPGWLHLH